MANTYHVLGSTTLTAGNQATITFSAIPQTYTDLILRLSVRNSTVNYGGYQIRLNGATSSNAWKALRYTNGAVDSVSRSDAIDVCNLPISTDATNTFSCDEVYIPNYTSSNYKSFYADSVRENQSSLDNVLKLAAGLYSSTSAVTSIDVTLDTDSFKQYSVATLYGIKNS